MTDTAEAVVEMREIVEAIVAVVRPRVGDPHAANDLCQEAAARVIDVRERLDPDAVVPYAVTVAKNLVVDRIRTSELDRRQRHRLVDQVQAIGPDDEVVVAEERRSMVDAFDRLPPGDRQVLVDHVVDGLDLSSIADRTQSSAGAVASHLGRAKAKLRVEYALAAHRIELPSAQCRPVLAALSAADQRRQVAVNAPDHLAGCETCARLAPALVERDRQRLGVAPVAMPIALWFMLKAWAVHHPVLAVISAAAASASTAGVIIVATAAPSVQTAAAPPPPAAPVVTTAAPTAPPPPAPPAPLTIDGQPLLPLVPAGNMAGRAGETVAAQEVPVVAVPADEGFWIGGEPGRRVWVQLTGEGESPATIEAGGVVSFSSGRLVAHDPAYAAAVGLDPADGADELDRAQAHIEVAATAVQFRPA